MIDYDHNFPYSLMSYWLIFAIDLQMILPLVYFLLIFKRKIEEILHGHDTALDRLGFLSNLSDFGQFLLPRPFPNATS